MSEKQPDLNLTAFAAKLAAIGETFEKTTVRNPGDAQTRFRELGQALREASALLGQQSLEKP